MHLVPGLKVLYFGTPVVLVSTLNPDGTANLAPMSSAWWLGQAAMLGMGANSQTAANLRRHVSPSRLADAWAMPKAASAA